MSHFDSDTFRQEVIDIVRQIPRGRVLTYGLIARLQAILCMPVMWEKPCMGLKIKPFRVIVW